MVLYLIKVNEIPVITLLFPGVATVRFVLSFKPSRLLLGDIYFESGGWGEGVAGSRPLDKPFQKALSSHRSL